MPTRWLIAAGAGLIAMMGFASRGAFGVFFVQMLEEYPWDRASLAGVYSVGMLVMGFAGVWAGGLSQRIGPKRYFLVGAAVVGLTFVLASTARTLFQVYLTYGVLGGISLAMLGLGPTQALVARWFDTRRGLALGIVAAGAGAYSLVAPLAQVLVDAVGWRWAMVVMGAILFLASDLYRGPGFAAILGFITLGFGTGGATGPWLAGLVYEWSGSYDAMLWFVLAALAGGALAMAGARRAGSPAK